MKKNISTEKIKKLHNVYLRNTSIPDLAGSDNHFVADNKVRSERVRAEIQGREEIAGGRSGYFSFRIAADTSDTIMYSGITSAMAPKPISTIASIIRRIRPYLPSFPLNLR